MYYNQEEETLLQEKMTDMQTQLNIDRNTKEFNLLKDQFKEELRQGKNVSATFNKMVKTINGLPDAKPSVIIKRAIDIAGLAATSKAPYLYGQMRQGLTLAINRISSLGKLDNSVSSVIERAVISYEKRLPTIKDPEIHRGCSMLVSALKSVQGTVKTKIVNTPTDKTRIANAQESYEFDDYDEEILAECIDTFLESMLDAGMDIDDLLSENLRSVTRRMTRGVMGGTGKVTNAVDTVGNTVMDERRKRKIMEARKQVMEGRVPPSRYVREAIKWVAVGVGAVNPYLGIPMIVSGYMRRRKLSQNERLNLIDELTAEMEIINEKIKDSEADGNRQMKYNYIRLRREVQRGIDQLKYGQRFSIDRNPIRL